LVGNGDRIERSPLLTNRISAAPVVGTDGKIVGIVSEGDLMRRAEAGTGRRRSWWLSLLTGREVLAAEYIMGAIRWGLASRAAISLFMRPGTVLWSYGS
jgi:CBS-domain-containing membrane protein